MASPDYLNNWITPALLLICRFILPENQKHSWAGFKSSANGSSKTRFTIISILLVHKLTLICGAREYFLLKLRWNSGFVKGKTDRINWGVNNYLGTILPISRLM